MSQTTFTPLELRTQYENLIDDSHDVTHEYQLLTQAKNRIESMLKPAILLSGDESQTTSPGDTYLTLKSVPADFKEMVKLMVGTIPYHETAFIKRMQMRNAARRFYIDYKKMIQGLPSLGLTGTIASTQILQMTYLVRTPSLTEANEDTPGIVLWPDDYQPLIPYAAAIVFQGNIDPDDIALRQAIAQNQEMQNILDAFIAWDHDIKLAAMGGIAGFLEEDEPLDIGLL